MNWKARANGLAEELQAHGISDPRILERFANVPRHLFMPAELEHEAYNDCALSIGLGQTISQPYIVALMTQAAELQPEHTVLEIGTGSGYQAAILTALCRRVVTVERLPELAESAQKVWQALGYDNIESHVGDGTQGWPADAPYDAILVTAGSPSVPEALLFQLAQRGRLVIPEGPADHQHLMVYRRVDGHFTSHKLCDCRFVKLLGEAGWPVEDEIDAITS